ncbi:MAG: pentapeptide repeat-containing protein [Actinomycetota bacterium]
MLSSVVIGGMLLPLAIGIIEINHRRSKDVILLRVEADTLVGAELSGALLLGADLTGMRCTGANFRDARMMRACLIEADLATADLRGADLRGATLLGVDLTGARYDDSTRWPAQFDPSACGAVKVTGDE